MPETNDEPISNPPPKTWRIEVLRDLDCIVRYDVPAHRLEDKSVYDFLKSIVLKYEDLTAVEFISALLNKRRGGPIGIEIAKPHQERNLDKKRIGYTVSGPRVTAMAYWTMSADVEEFIRTQIRKR